MTVDTKNPQNPRKRKWFSANQSLDFVSIATTSENSGCLRMTSYAMEKNFPSYFILVVYNDVQIACSANFLEYRVYYLLVKFIDHIMSHTSITLPSMKFQWTN